MPKDDQNEERRPWGFRPTNVGYSGTVPRGKVSRALDENGFPKAPRGGTGASGRRPKPDTTTEPEK